MNVWIVSLLSGFVGSVVVAAASFGILWWQELGDMQRLQIDRLDDQLMLINVKTNEAEIAVDVIPHIVGPSFGQDRSLAPLVQIAFQQFLLTHLMPLAELAARAEVFGHPPVRQLIDNIKALNDVTSKMVNINTRGRTSEQHKNEMENAECTRIEVKSKLTEQRDAYREDLTTRRNELLRMNRWQARRAHLKRVAA